MAVRPSRCKKGRASFPSAPTARKKQKPQRARRLTKERRTLREIGFLCDPSCPLWLNSSDDLSTLHCLYCDPSRRPRPPFLGVETEHNRGRAPEQSRRRLHEPAAFREGIEVFSAGGGSRSQAGDCAPERRHRIPEPAESGRS